MPSTTKVNLSNKELRLVLSEESVRLKLSIQQKVNAILTARIPAIHAAIITYLPEQIQHQLVHPKISRGEQYQQLPYLILDYPRIFNKDIFVVRTMFWWAHFFSITLQISGNFLEHYRELILNTYHLLPTNFFICIADDPWQHHFETDNYIPLHQLSWEEWECFLQKAAFIKLAVKFNLDDWSKIEMLLDEAYTQIGSIFHQLPKR